MKLTHQAAAYASNLMRKKDEGVYDNAFTKYPELYQPAFWELVMAQAADPSLAAKVLDELHKLGEEGATYSPKIAANLTEAMKTARRTLRSEEIKRLNRKTR